MTTSRFTIPRAALALAAILVGAAGGCGGVSNSDVVSARTQATNASCDYFQMCGDIGTGLMFDTYADCQTQILGEWTSGWPTSACQGHIDGDALNVCVDAIKSTTACNGIAELITLGKCSSSTVCSNGVSPDASRD